MKYLLCPFLLAYRLGCMARNCFYNLNIFKSRKAPLYVISIGNISFGGSGKTPLAMSLLSALLNEGLKPALISRGYKGNWEKKGGVLSNGKSILGKWEDSGDEPFMVALRIPQAGIFVGKDRFSSCRRADNLGFNAAVLDDGFQYRGLSKDIDIVLYDPAERIFLREPFSCLKRANIILVEKRIDARTKKRINEHFPGTSLYEYSVNVKGFFRLGQNKGESSSVLRGKKTLVFCGIASPERFFSLLGTEGIKPDVFLKFPDHHSYPSSSLDKIITLSKKIKAEAIITSEKDAVKIVNLDDFLKIPIYVLKIDFKPEKAFFTSVLSSLKAEKKSRNII